MYWIQAVDTVGICFKFIFYWQQAAAGKNAVFLSSTGWHSWHSSLSFPKVNFILISFMGLISDIFFIRIGADVSWISTCSARHLLHTCLGTYSCYVSRQRLLLNRLTFWLTHKNWVRSFEWLTLQNGIYLTLLWLGVFWFSSYCLGRFCEIFVFFVLAMLWVNVNDYLSLCLLT